MPISSRMLIPVPSEDEFFDSLSPATLLRWAQIDTEARQSVQSYTRRTFVLARLLKPFFTSEQYAAFRLLQEETGTLISGSVALHFFDRTPLSVYTDLDLYVDLRFCAQLGDWLMTIGYQYQSRDPTDSATFHEVLQQIEDEWDDVEDAGPVSWFDNASPWPETPYQDPVEIAEVFDFYKKGRKIQIIACYNSPLRVIMNFHSTCVMNFITHEKAYSLYPWGTFEERWSLIHRRDNYHHPTPDVIAKYARRGWAMLSRVPPHSDQHLKFVAEKRRLVGDRYCWTITLDHARPDSDTDSSAGAITVIWGKPTMSLVEANSWMLAPQQPTNYAKFSCFYLTSANLKFRYIVADDVMRVFLRKAWKSNGNVGQGDREVAYKDAKLRAMIWRRFAKDLAVKKQRRKLKRAGAQQNRIN
ncbi:hypothetical protein BJ165DRAFT_676617 [Panaeolus papilionaceus]|nr:hypothetical protein BJ165DRAFT_676617 [Panaeolus papilionaceus]